MIKLLIKCTFHFYIVGTAEFPTLFNLNFLVFPWSPPVAQWLHFRASVRNGMPFSPRRRTPFFPYLCSTSIFVSYNLFLRSFKLSHVYVKKSSKRGHRTCLTVNNIHLVISFFLFKVYLLELLSNGEDPKKNAS